MKINKPTIKLIIIFLALGFVLLFVSCANDKNNQEEVNDTVDEQEGVDINIENKQLKIKIEEDGFLKACVDPVVFVRRFGRWKRVITKPPSKSAYYVDDVLYVVGNPYCMGCFDLGDDNNNIIKVNLTEYVEQGKRKIPKTEEQKEQPQVVSFKTIPLEGEIKIELTYYTDSECKDEKVIYKFLKITESEDGIGIEDSEVDRPKLGE